MASLFSAILTEGRQVRIVPNAGWSSESFMKENLDRLSYYTRFKDESTNWFAGSRDVYILYYGDYDPTGLRMVENLRNELESMNINFEHVAITKEQIEQFGLGHLIDPDRTV
jgi:hypothetical protein